jgi:hypothetical protein
MIRYARERHGKKDQFRAAAAGEGLEMSAIIVLSRSMLVITAGD